MNFKVFTLITARSQYFSNNIITGMLYFANYYYVFTENDTALCRLVSSETDPARPSTSRSLSSGPSSKRKCNSQNRTANSALGWSLLDQQPSLPLFSEQSGSTAAVDVSSTLFDLFFYFLSRIYDKTYKNRNKQVC
jgi:hypothetical protein